ncbi:MAG: TrkA family potassium uptake protein [Planctomycetes bacterium]|nr:TrkA family potassium uptake protein [Planctomycetota bacterium]
MRICVIGLGRLGMSLAVMLERNGHEVLAIDMDERLIEAVKDKVTLAVRADATDEEVLRSLGVQTVDHAVVAIGQDFEATQLALLACQEVGVPKIHVRATDAVKQKILRRLDASAKILMPEEEAAKKLARVLSHRSLSELLTLDDEHSVVYVTTPPKLVGITLGELKPRERFNVNIIAIKYRASQTLVRKREDMFSGEGDDMGPEHIRIPTGKTTIHGGDTLLIIGKDSDIDRFLREYE